MNTEQRIHIASDDFQNIIATSLDGFLMADMAGKILEVNASYCQLVGYTCKELLSMDISTVDAIDNQEVVERRLVQIQKYGSLRFETRHQCKDGTVIDLEISANYSPSHNGTIFSFLRDITKRKQIEEALAIQADFNKRIFNSSTANLAVIDRHGVILEINDSWRNFAIDNMGEDASTWDVGANYFVKYDESCGDTEQAQAVFDGIHKVQNGQLPSFILEYPCHGPGDVKRWFQLNAFPLQGDVGSVLISHTNITELRRAKEALIESEERFRSLVESIPNVSVQGYNRERQVIFWNKASEALYGYSHAEALGCRLETLIIPESMRSDIISAVNCWLTDGVPIPAGELDLQKKDGSQVSVYSSHVMQKNSRGEAEMYCVDIDLTERKQAEEAQEKLQLQLVQAQKIESVGRLAGGVAHDFNNKLSVIIGYVELALMGIAADNPLIDALKEIRKAAESSADLTRQLLAFARKQTVSPKVLDLNDTVAGMLTMLRRLIGEDIKLAWQPGAKLWPVNIDPSQIDQMLANLCINSSDAIGGTGTISISTKAAVFDAEYCTSHQGFTPGDYVSLMVSDSGCGMDAETQANIFEPFFTTKEVGRGTGLGLASVYGVVKQNGGFINVYSEPGIGTIFTIYLPCYLGKNGQSHQDTTVPPVTRGNETILLVEDETAILKVTAMLLKSMGYNVLPTATPGEAMRLAREHTGEINLLMTDVIMPEMNGRDLARNLLSLYPDLKRLFMSGYTADIIAERGVIDEGVNFIQKPFTMPALAKQVREVLEG